MIVATLNRYSSYVKATIRNIGSIAFVGKVQVGVRSDIIGQSLAAPYKEVVAIQREPILIAPIIYKNDN